MTKRDIDKAAKEKIKRERERKHAIRDIAAYMQFNAASLRTTKREARDIMRTLQAY